MTQPPSGPPPSDPGPPEFPPYPTPTGPGYPPVGPPPTGGYPPVPPAGPAGVEPYPPYPPANPAGGYPPPPPGYPSAPYGYPAAGAYPPVESARSTNGFAITALIFGIIPCLGGILGIIFGILGLNQIKRTGQNGRGLAIAGIALGSLWVIASITVIAAGINDKPKRDDSGHVTQSGDMDVTQLRVGDCVADLGDKDFYTTTKAIPCAQPHKAEVYALLPLSGSSVPPQSVLDEKGNEGCSTALESYSPSAFEDDGVEITYLYPTKRSWAQGDHSIACVAVFSTERTASIKGK
ncbi:DUF4190 domain-containing protein [Mycobacteroides chelonae]|uniref:DUF4190 domain-containing protein n=1 Tax=Mycobacteroides chelonae TaxID=1774 RepID=UPI0008A8DEB6|nr:DUF4190 domain-containing protein [Mycobacteroides chelonae]OHU61580.1 peptidylprolyl isomerase [Mycobacteroides chelonae]